MYCIEAPSNYRDDEQVDFLPVTEAGGGRKPSVRVSKIDRTTIFQLPSRPITFLIVFFLVLTVISLKLVAVISSP
ncbi:hypothetical protein DW909_07910 [Bifidobacterium bifidum]|nr:hypothetical protein DW909_07910 [Bifidobacterium bifidum]